MSLTGRPRWSPVVFLTVSALAASACAGSLGQYGNAAPAPALVVTGQPEGVSSATSGRPIEAAGVPELGTDTAGPGSAGAAGPSSAAGDAHARAGTGAGLVASRTASSGMAAPGPGTSTTGPAGGAPAPGSPSGGTSIPAGPMGGGADGTGPSSPGTVPAAPATPGVTKDAVTLGLFYSKTGAYSGLVRNAPAVLQAAFDEAGPIHGRRLVLKTYDDGTANASTIQVEEKRAKDEVFALLSGVSESNVVLAPLADQHRVPLLVGNIDESVGRPLTYVFPLWSYWGHQARILPGFIQNVLHGADKRIGIVYEGTSTAKEAKDAFKAKAAEMGMTVVYEQPIAQNQSACVNEVSNLQARNVELVFMMNGPLGAICMLRDARALAYRPLWTGVGASWSFNMVATASGGAADGIQTLSTMTTLDTPAGRHFSAVMQRHAPNSGAEDDDFMLASYGFAQTLIEALRRTGPDLTRDAYVQTLETKMSGFDSGYLPPPTFGPRDRSGPLVLGVTACCSGGRWTTPQPGWRASF